MENEGAKALGMKCHTVHHEMRNAQQLLQYNIRILFIHIPHVVFCFNGFIASEEHATSCGGRTTRAMEFVEFACVLEKLLEVSFGAEMEYW